MRPGRRQVRRNRRSNRPPESKGNVRRVRAAANAETSERCSLDTVSREILPTAQVPPSFAVAVCFEMDFHFASVRPRDFR